MYIEPQEDNSYGGTDNRVASFLKKYKDAEYNF